MTQRPTLHDCDKPPPPLFFHKGGPVTRREAQLHKYTRKRMQAYFRTTRILLPALHLNAHEVLANSTVFNCRHEREQDIGRRGTSPTLAPPSVQVFENFELSPTVSLPFNGSTDWSKRDVEHTIYIADNEPEVSVS